MRLQSLVVAAAALVLAACDGEFSSSSFQLGEVEPNDSAAFAQPIVGYTDGVLQGKCDSGADVDYVRFEKMSGKVDILLDWTDGVHGLTFDPTQGVTNAWRHTDWDSPIRFDARFDGIAVLAIDCREIPVPAGLDWELEIKVR